MARTTCINPTCGKSFMDAVRPQSGYCSVCGFPLEGTVWEKTEEQAPVEKKISIGSDGKVDLGIAQDVVTRPKDVRANGLGSLRPERPKGRKENAARITIYANGQPIGSRNLDTDLFEIGRSDIDYRPDFDLTSFDPEYRTSRRHVELIRREDQFFVRRISEKNSVHLNRQAIPHNQDVAIKHGDAIVLSQFVGILFEQAESPHE